MSWRISDDNYETELDLGLRRSLRWRRARRWLVLLVLVGVFLELKGLPHVRVTTPTRSAGPGSAEYWSVGGTRRCSVRNAPLVVLLPLERPLLDYMHATAADMWQQVASLSRVDGRD